MKKLLITAIILIIAQIGYSQYVHDLFPCRDSTGARVEGCFAWSDSSGQYIQVTDTMYCLGDNLIVSYSAVNNAWGYNVGEIVSSDTILGVCASASAGSTDDQLLSTSGSAGNISIEGGNTITINVEDADSDPTNEIQDISGIANNTQAIQDTASQIRADFPIDTDTQLNEAEVDAFVSNNGYLTSESDAIAISALTDTSAAIRSDFPIDTDTQLSESQVIQIVRDTGFLESETDPIWIADSVNYAKKSYADQAEQDAKDYADANDDINDADSDPTNELQDISGIAANAQAIQDTAAQIRADFPIGATDDQTLSIDSLNRVFTVSIEAGNFIKFEDRDSVLNESTVEGYIDGNEASFSGWDKNEVDDFSGSWNDLTNIPAGFSDNVDNVDDADNNVTNEIQSISIDSTGRVFTITLTSGGMVTFEDTNTQNPFQTLSWSAGTGGNDEITLSDGGGTITITDSVNDADNDPTNELQDISGITTNQQAIQDTAAQIRADFPVDTDTNDVDSTRLTQDSILVYYLNGSETGRDTISGIGASGGTDDQTLSFVSPNLSISNGNTVDLTPLQDGTGTDDQVISIDSVGRVFTITLEDGGTVTFEDTNTQDGTGTDDQTASEVSYNNVTSGIIATDVQAAIDEVEARVDVNDAKVTNTDDQAISIDSTGRVFTVTLEDGGAVTFEDTDTTIPDTDDQTLSIDGSNNLIISDGNQVSLSPYLDNTDSQDLTLTGNTLAITGDPNTDVDLSAYLDDTTIPDDQTLSIDSTGRVFSISIADGNTVNFEDTNTQLNESQVEAFIDGNETSFNGWDKNESDDFDGAWGSLSGVPAGFSDNVDDVDDADNNATNEIQSISIDSTGRVFTITLSSGGTVTFEDTNTQNPYQSLSWSAGTGGNDEITLSDGGGTITITDDDNQLSNEQVQDIVGSMVSGNTERMSLISL